MDAPEGWWAAVKSSDAVLHALPPLLVLPGFGPGTARGTRTDPLGPLALPMPSSANRAKPSNRIPKRRCDLFEFRLIILYTKLLGTKCKTKKWKEPDKVRIQV